MERLLLQCLCIRNDLQQAKTNIREKGLLLSITEMKIAFFAFHNLCDLEKHMRAMYSQHNGLSAKFDIFRANADFFSYLRNKFAGHLTNDLIYKALEWKPELKMLLDKEYDPKIVSVFNLFFFWKQQSILM